MSGNFILYNIKTSELIKIQAFPIAGIYLGISHVEQKNQDHYDFFEDCLYERIHNSSRQLLPRHLYIEIKMGHSAEDVRNALKESAWIDRLIRPKQIPLKALCPQASVAWKNQDKLGAFMAQLCTGPVSLEIYYQDGIQV